MAVITVIKKIGEKILSVVEWPIKHSVMLAEMFSEFIKDEPKVKADIVTLVQKLEAFGPDALKALAQSGLNIPADLAAAADIQGLFTFVTQTLLPDIEADYADFKKDAEIVEPPAASAPAPVSTEPPASDATSGPGLHTVTAQ